MSKRIDLAAGLGSLKQDMQASPIQEQEAEVAAPAVPAASKPEPAVQVARPIQRTDDLNEILEEITDIPEKDELVTYSFRLPGGLKRRLFKVGDSNNISNSEITRRAIEFFVTHMEKRPGKRGR